MPSLRSFQIAFALAFGFALPTHATAADPSPLPPTRFEKAVLEVEARDKTQPAPRGAILLAGDSQFFRWKTLAEDLPGYSLVNHGIDSFTFPDLLQFTDRLVLPTRPRLIVLHVGGNDVHQGRKAEAILADFQSFVARVRAALPDARIAFTSITPSPGRWDEADRRRQANQLLRDYIVGQRGLFFIDLWDAMLTAEGKPREDLWVEDRIHPNHAGYLVRVRIMQPLLGEPDHPVTPQNPVPAAGRRQ